MGEVDIVFRIIKNKDLSDIKDIIIKNNPKAFYSIENVDAISEGIFPSKNTNFNLFELRKFKPFRKGK
jgi:hypothetical protein